MKLPRLLQPRLWIGVLSLCFAVSAAAQSTPPPAEGLDSGNYNIRQTVEFGYRNSDVSGNLANYGTFVNLNSGVRLFEQSVDIRSLNHTGAPFRHPVDVQLRVRRRSERRHAVADR